MAEDMNNFQMDHEGLEAAYREMAQDEEREAEALEWAEATIGDVANEPRLYRSLPCNGAY